MWCGPRVRAGECVVRVTGILALVGIYVLAVCVLRQDGVVSMTIVGLIVYMVTGQLPKIHKLLEENNRRH
jgi:uncharacterized membrane protein (Fun14 family)